MSRKLQLLAVAALASIGIWQLGSGIQIHARAWLGQILLERAWASQTESAEPVRPWPGAETWPVARLQVPELDVERMVLEGSDGPSLAWGPGRLAGSAPINGPGHLVLAAHRDTHFRFLKDLQPDNRLVLTTPGGQARSWRVEATSVVDSRTTVLDLGLQEDRLTLVTCYPFDSPVSGGPLRFVVHLYPESGAIDAPERTPRFVPKPADSGRPEKIIL